MGGAAGHMAHPFDCREVRNGRDLIKFYVKAVNAIPLYDEESKGSSVSLKLDGVNASFRLQKANNPAGFMFVLDRGAKKRGPITGLDFDGITPDNAVERWKGNTEHGMIQVVSHMTKLLNHDLMKLKPYVEALGLFERMGPEGVFFDAEYYANEDDPEGPDAERGYKPVKNAIDYNQNYIAIHRLSEFYIETKETKTGKISERRLTRGFYWETVEEINVLLKQKDELLSQRQDTADIDQLIAEKNNELKAKKQEHQEILGNLARVVQKHATDLEMPFNVYTKIGVRFKEGLTREMVLRNVEEALDTKVPYNYKKVSDEMSVGPVSINEQTGEFEARTLKQLLLSVEQNPAHIAYYPDSPGFTKDGESVKGKIQTKDGYKKDPKQSAFALDIYKDVMVTGHKTGIGPADIGNSINDVKAINSAVIFWHAVRYIGRAIKESIVTDVDMGAKKHEGIVIQSTDICDGIAFKFTGEFILDNASRGFGVTQHGTDIPSDSSEAMNETRVKYGELLESFMVEAEPVMEQERSLVVLIPGGFKPPTNGHFSMINQYEKRSDVSKVIIVTGFKPRKEPGLAVTHEQSKAIFDIYGGFGDKVEFRDQGNWPTPMRTCYEMVKDKSFISEFPGAVFALGASDKQGDKERIPAFYNHFQKNPSPAGAEVINYPPAKAFEVDGKAASASRMRKAFVKGDWEAFKRLMPNDSYYDDVIQVLNKQTRSQEVTSEGFFTMTSQSSLVNEIFYLIDEILLEKQQQMPSDLIEVDEEEEVGEKLKDEKTVVGVAMAKLVLDPSITGMYIPDDKKKMMIGQLTDLVLQRLRADVNQHSEDPEEQIQNITAEESSMGGGNVQGGTGDQDYDSVIR